MITEAWRVFRGAALAIVLLPALRATTIARLTFEQLTDNSERIVSGTVTQSSTAWDAEHKFIWTHYRLSVSETLKGGQTSSIDFAEPGGALGGVVMTIPGAVTYAVGERVVIFLSRMPNGYLRTTGWSQGRYRLDENGRLHGSPALGAETIDLTHAPAGVSLSTLEGMSVSGLKQRIAQRSAK